MSWCLAVQSCHLSEQQGAKHTALGYSSAHSHGVGGVTFEPNSLWSFMQGVQYSTADGGSDADQIQFCEHFLWEFVVVLNIDLGNLKNFLL